ncbi:MAG: nuclear transport factor 2 family protein [Methanomicrobiales archaeon]|nr:nuclear transport factor 2 family protein [Methanomicrobiales archaeon]
MTVSIQTRDQIEAVVRALIDAYAKQDVAGVMALIGDGFAGYGAGSDAVIASREEFRGRLEQTFRESGAIAVAVSGLQIHAVGTVAWIAARAEIETAAGSRRERVAVRLTAVLEGTGHAWRFVQSHVSLPAPAPLHGLFG